VQPPRIGRHEMGEHW